MKVQVLSQSKTDPFVFIVMSDGKTFEYQIMPDTIPEVLHQLKYAARKRRVMELDVSDIKNSRRIGVQSL